MQDKPTQPPKDPEQVEEVRARQVIRISVGPSPELLKYLSEGWVISEDQPHFKKPPQK